MGGADEAHMRDEAIDWVIRLKSASDTDWDRFSEWMAGDARRHDIYWQVAQADANAGEALAADYAVHAVSMPSPSVRPWRRVMAGVLCAAGLAVAASIFWFQNGPDMQSIATPGGQIRVASLPDGSSVTLNGGSAVSYDMGDPRSIRLDRGQALFTVRHDPTHPFTVRAGDTTITDLGTRFDVSRLGADMRLAVVEGRVRYSAANHIFELGAGDILEARAGTTPVVRRVDPAAIDGWSEGRLSFEDDRLSVVAEQLSRVTGLAVAVAPAIGDRRVSGGLSTDNSDRVDTLRRAALLFGVEAVQDKGRWTLIAQGSRAP
ncbi:FecR family protein [Sphingobium sp.]|uniref:FecR family protein n=1 Tax=Sphingobium sp. TaxID=1912891 RepID=UPI003B3BBB6F